jgi:hypothetical protein
MIKLTYINPILFCLANYWVSNNAATCQKSYQNHENFLEYLGNIKTCL